MARTSLGAFVRSTLDPRAWLHVLRLVNHYNYTHVQQRRKVVMGPGVLFSPNVSITNGERVEIGARSHIGARCSLWAGDETGRIVIGADALFGPNVFLTASDYRYDLGSPVYDQPKREQDVVIGRDVWLGAGVIVVAGVTVGDGCVVGAGSIVTQSLPPGSIAVGAPARVVGVRPQAAGAGVDPDPRRAPTSPTGRR